jgi:UDP-N-acetylglucosamine--N-acetylmuramyl-(pentapeptide) pyrophosphoryl-undecaprenol N-acetylglucosamine transferase
MTIDVLLTGGGTAGHVLPAIATAQALQRVRPELRVVFAGLPDSIEERLVTAAGFDFERIRAVALPRRATPNLLRVPGRLLAAVRHARRLLRDRGVRTVVSFGGYVGLPVALAARRRIPLILHEQNSRPGIANRRTARSARFVAVSFPSSAERFPDPERCRFIGNPVQDRLRALDRATRRAAARVEFGLNPDRATVLVFGGSQGARSINAAVAQGGEAWRRLGIQLLQVTGPRGMDEAQARWRDEGVDPQGPDSGVRLVEYLSDMSDAYAAADLVVCRAGATSIAELTVLGLPAILIPYPHATADHQRHNAAALEAAGAAIVIDDADLDGACLLAHVEPFFADPVRAARMGLAARAWGRPDAAEGMAALVLEVLATSVVAGGRSAPEGAER